MNYMPMPELLERDINDGLKFGPRGLAMLINGEWFIWAGDDNVYQYLTHPGADMVYYQHLGSMPDDSHHNSLEKFEAFIAACF